MNERNKIKRTNTHQFIFSFFESVGGCLCVDSSLSCKNTNNLSKHKTKQTNNQQKATTNKWKKNKNKKTNSKGWLAWRVWGDR